MSSVLMGALTVAFIIADFSFNYGQNILNYIFLGSITTILFYMLCSLGYEIINWIFLAIIPIYVFFALLSKFFRKVEISDMSAMSDACNSCGISLDNCDCTDSIYLYKNKKKPKTPPQKCP
jgi:predicted membrane protein